ncbi:MAG: Athe_2463 domain-containing protein [Moorellales bacterium]
MLKAFKTRSVLAAAVLAAFLLALVPALPARAGAVADAANEFLKKTFDLRFDYFKAENEAGKALREIALQGEASEDWPVLAWGDAHGDKKTDSRGRTQYRYVGYSKFDEDVTNPFFPPDETAGGRLDQRNWIQYPWYDSRTEHFIQDTTFDTQNNPWLNERLRWGLYWAAKCNGFDPPATTSDLYKNPQKYVHVILPPAEGTWGMGRMWHITSSGKVWYVSVPLGPPMDESYAEKTPDFYVKDFDPGCPKNEKGEYEAKPGETYTATAVFGAKNLWPPEENAVVFPAVASVAGFHKVGGVWYRADLKSGQDALAGARFASAGMLDVAQGYPAPRLFSGRVAGQQAVMFGEAGEIRLSFNWTAQNVPEAVVAAAINLYYPDEDPILKPLWWEGGDPPPGYSDAPEPDLIARIQEVQATREGRGSAVFGNNVAAVTIRIGLADFYVKSLNPGTSEVIEGERYTGTVTFGLKPGTAAQKARLVLTHNGWSVSGVDGRVEEFEPGQERTYTFQFTGQAQDSILIAEIWPEEGQDGAPGDNTKQVTVPLKKEGGVPDQPGSLTFQAVSQTRKHTRPADTAKWTDWVTATLKPPTPDPPRSDASIEDWWIESASLTYPRKNPEFTIGCPYPPSGTRTVSMTVQPDRKTAKVEFQEDWALDGAPVYCLLEGRLMAETPRYYTITARYTVGYRYAWLERRTGYYTCCSGTGKDARCGTCSYTYYVRREATGSSSGTVSGKLLVNGTGVDSRAQ